MNISDIMCNEVFTCRADDTLERAAGILWDHDCGSAPVVDGEGCIVGILTDRDICMAAYTQGKRLSDMLVSSAMCSDAHTCASHDAIATAQRIMQQQRVRRVPVIDSERRVVGIVSLNDIACAALESMGLQNPLVTPDEVTLTLGTVCQPRNARSSRRASGNQSSANQASGNQQLMKRAETGARSEKQSDKQRLART